ncbi:MAG: DUF7005 family protein [Oscillospiraceae bacterium]
MSVIGELAGRFPQIYIKPEEGASQSEIYRGIVRKGESFSGDLSHFICSDEDSLTVAETPAGKVEIVFLKNRADFECFYRIMAAKCEPVPILRTVGAAYIGGINDWSKIHAHLAEYAQNGGTDSTGEFARFTADKSNYKTSIILLSDGFYSNLSCENTPFSEEQWLKISLDIRKYHELTHFVCRHFFPTKINAVWDEIIADFYGLLCATGSYDAALALKFLGIVDGKYTGGRLERYVEAPITEELVGEIVGISALLEEFVPEKFDRDEDNFSTVISIQERSEDFLKNTSL